jgi:uncharacterized protein (DUF2062 family)
VPATKVGTILNLSAGLHGGPIPRRSILRRFLPTQESIKGNRLLRWLGPRLHEPGLWHLNRRAVARGMAIGVFFGFMIPVAQIPAAAIGAFLARANLWVSAIATLVSNPFTYAPIYYAAYRLGGFLLGAPEAAAAADLDPALAHAVTPSLEHAASGVGAWLAEIWTRLAAYGKPLFLGLGIMAVSLSVLAYFGTLLAWRAAVVIKRRRPRQLRARA